MSTARRLDWNLRPLEVLRRWPAETPLAALLSGGDSPWSRVTVIGAPGRWNALRPVDGLKAGDAIEWLRAITRETVSAKPTGRTDDGPPMGPGWFAQFSYELGGVLEPTARDRTTSARARDASRAWPLIQVARCEHAFVFDHLQRQWWSIGGAIDRVALRDPEVAEHCECTSLEEESSDAEYAQAVRRTIELIHAGDLFQANIARRWHGELRGSPRAFAHRALQSSAARYGAWLETPAGMLASMSPELFLDLDERRRAVSRPIKGTRPSETGAAELARSGKDAAELHMIVDLMRNDLSRACRPGTVQVREARTLETHGTVVHGVAEIHGELRDTCDRADLLAGTFPPGSVTGAPKIRAMQVIDELERVSRGPYCGAIGYLSDSGAMKLSVAIRTAELREIEPRRFALSYAAGCGITSDSRPDEEVAESHAKVRVLEQAIRETALSGV
ncbi:MAG: anthranilate synthase component I family protein [Planctomycetes bacterium]|nr:anthranilate synthase component I family protein [Planctomycetota bacterium]